MNDGIKDSEPSLLQCHAYSEQKRILLWLMKYVNKMVS